MIYFIPHVSALTGDGVEELLEAVLLQAELLELDIPQMAQIALPILNTSVHRVHVTPHGRILATFNSSPHLDHADRLTARTNY